MVDDFEVPRHELIEARKIAARQRDNRRKIFRVKANVIRKGE
jgi:hypothetical protein